METFFPLWKKKKSFVSPSFAKQMNKHKGSKQRKHCVGSVIRCEILSKKPRNKRIENITEHFNVSKVS